MHARRTGGFEPNANDLAGGTAATQGEVEALNRILNNINVQTKKSDAPDKLPPIKK